MTVKTPIKVKYEELLNHVMPGVVTDLEINILLMYDTFFSVVAYCYVFFLLRQHHHEFKHMHVNPLPALTH